MSDSIAVASILVKRVGWWSYEAFISYRPQQGDSPFIPLIVERGPYCALSHFRAWYKAWKDAGKPTIVGFHEL